jgi:hypothetical protein
MYMCVYAYICMCTVECVRECVYMYVCECMYVCYRMCEGMRTYKYVCLCMYVYCRMCEGMRKAVEPHVSSERILIWQIWHVRDKKVRQ